MANGFSAIENGLSALRAFRAATETISHNIANAATEGYTRQEVKIAARPAATYFGFNSLATVTSGDGSEVDDIRRFRNAFLDRRFRSAAQETGRLTIESDSLSRIEQSFNEPSDSGVTANMNRFFTAWQDVANNPESSSGRTALVERSQSLALRFNEAAAALQGEQRNLDLIVGGRVREVNDLAQRIADLNGKIRIAKAVGQTPNDLMDERDLKIDKLATYASITYADNPDGTIDVSIGGRALVAGNAANAIATTPGPNGYQQVVWAADNAAVALTSGEIFGAITVRDTLIANQLATLDGLANGIMAAVNALHTTGIGLDGATGLPFFTGAGAAAIAVNPALVTSPRSIGAAAGPAGLPGDNAIALQIANLLEAKTMNGATATFTSYWNTAIAQLGIDVEHASVERESQQAIQAQMAKDRDAESGVSLDEEAANLVRFQRSFEAAAHVIKVVDEMLATVIRDMGLTGR
jgi:flagellar hook-associated protein 1 FlgK